MNVKYKSKYFKYTREKKKKYKLFTLDDFFKTTEDFRFSSVSTFSKKDVFADKVVHYMQ